MTREIVMAVCLLTLPATAQAQSFSLPLDSSCSGGGCPVTAYMDHGPRRDSEGRHQETSDWNCGTQTYGNHHGTDIAPSHGFGSCVSSVWVLAAAAGTVVVAHDGEEDHCDCREGYNRCASGYGNHVIIRHEDGTHTLYGHLARGSVAVSEGPVDCGTPLGRVGLSGNSTGPHLHFEVRTSSNTWSSAFDPFHGECSARGSRWANQGTYLDLPSAICEGGGVGDVCGDDVCGGTEDGWSCPADCGAAGPECGNGICESGEDRSTCPGDCPAPGPVCGNGACESGEDRGSCPDDCGRDGPVCGNGICESGEDGWSCAGDCGDPGPVCGNRVCESGEDGWSCPADCGDPGPICGDARCESGEDRWSCPTDCGGPGEACSSDADCSPGYSCEVGVCSAPACTVASHLTSGYNGDPCGPADEGLWRCVFCPTWGNRVAQVCRDGEWLSYDSSEPRDCAACCGAYSIACELP